MKGDLKMIGLAIVSAMTATTAITCITEGAVLGTIIFGAIVHKKIQRPIKRK